MIEVIQFGQLFHYNFISHQGRLLHRGGPFMCQRSAYKAAIAYRSLL